MGNREMALLTERTIEKQGAVSTGSQAESMQQHIEQGVRSPGRQPKRAPRGHWGHEAGGEEQSHGKQHEQEPEDSDETMWGSLLEEVMDAGCLRRQRVSGGGRLRTCPEEGGSPWGRYNPRGSPRKMV